MGIECYLCTQVCNGYLGNGYRYPGTHSKH